MDKNNESKLDEASVVPESSPAVEIEGVTESSAAAAIAGMEKELVNLKDQHLRLQAELENFRKRKNREAQDLRKFAPIPIVESLLPALDHFELALHSDHDRTTKEWGDGIALIARQIAESLRTHDIEEISPKKGDTFDTGVHEAVTRQPSNEVKSDHVLSVVRKGYRLQDRLIRAAQVIVAVKPTDEDNA